jgi:hypothetical protein
MQETQQTTEVEKTVTDVDGAQVEQRSVTQTTRVPGVVMAQRVIWFVVGLINILLITRFILLLLGANNDAGFVTFIYNITAPFVAPFVGIFGEPTYGQFMLEWSSLLAITVYSLIAWGIVKVITLSNPRQRI